MTVFKTTPQDVSFFVSDLRPYSSYGFQTQLSTMININPLCRYINILLPLLSTPSLTTVSSLTSMNILFISLRFILTFHPSSFSSSLGLFFNKPVGFFLVPVNGESSLQYFLLMSTFMRPIKTSLLPLIGRLIRHESHFKLRSSGHLTNPLLQNHTKLYCCLLHILSKTSKSLGTMIPSE